MNRIRQAPDGQIVEMEEAVSDRDQWVPENEPELEQPRRMSDEDYQIVQNQLMLFVGIVRDINLKGFCERIDIMHAMTPLLDPTLYRDAMDNGTMLTIDTLDRVAKKLIELQDIVNEAIEQEELGKARRARR